MADSKISDLPLSPYVLDKDLMVVVTGHLEEGTFPHNVKVPLSYIRRYIVRLNLLTSLQSGIGSYYNSGTNILTLQHIPLTGNLMRYDYDTAFPHNQTISNTGSNHIRGNLIDLRFDKNSPASTSMSSRNGPWFTNFNTKYLEEPYYSGIISVTGLNFRKENLIVIDIDNIWPHSGTVYNTGLNAIIGNNIDITFSQQHPASTIYGKTGPKYYSGIISTTGLNAYDSNLMRIDFHPSWPYSGIISQTGLNVIRGNLVDIQFSKESEAASGMHNRTGPWDNNFDKDKNLGEKYHSGIVSVTGLNAYDGNLMRIDFEEMWPYSGIISQTGLNAIAGNNINITFSEEDPANIIYGKTGPPYFSGIISTTGINAKSSHGIAYNINKDFPYDYSLLTIDKIGKTNSNKSFDNNTSGTINLYDNNTSLYFGDLFATYGNKNIDFFVSLLMPNNKTVTITIPNVSNSAVKAKELQYAPQASDWTPTSTILESEDLNSFASISIESINAIYLNDIITLKISGFLTSSASTTSINIPNSSIIDDNRINEDVFKHYATSNININDFKCNNNLKIAANYSLKNIRYKRVYTSASLETSYMTPLFYADNTRLTFNKPIILKTEHIYEPPSISWIVQPPNILNADKNTASISITGIAATDDYTKLTYQWYKSTNNINYTPIFGQNDTVLNTTISADTYFKNLASTYNCVGSFSNTTLAKLIVEGIECNVHPQDVVSCNGSNISFNGSASIIGAPTATINYQWYKNNSIITNGQSNDGTYTGANSNSLTISNINMNNLRGSIFYLQASYISPLVFSDVFLSTENNLNITTENNDKIISTIVSIATTFTCNTNGAKLWEAEINSVSHPINFESFRNYAYFSTSASGYKFDGANREPLPLQYSWQKLPSGSSNWNNISSSFVNPNTLTDDYIIVTGLLRGNTVPPSSLFLDNISFSNNLDRYRSIISLGCLSATGAPAELSVREIRILQQDSPELKTYKFPNNITYNNIILPTGNSLLLSITADIFNPFPDKTTLFYQWQQANFISNTINIDNDSWSDIENETSSTLSLSNLPENNTGLHKAYRLFIDDESILNNTDNITTIKRKTSNIFRVANPAYVSDSNNNIIYQQNNTWLVTREGSTNTINPPQLFISGLRNLNNISYLNTIRSIETNINTNTTYFAYVSMPPIIPEISSSNFATSLISGTIQTFTPETGILISVSGNPSDWSVRFIIPS